MRSGGNPWDARDEDEIHMGVPQAEFVLARVVGNAAQVGLHDVEINDERRCVEIFDAHPQTMLAREPYFLLGSTNRIWTRGGALR